MTMPQSPSRVIGSIRAENGKGTVRMEDVFATSATDLWSALTEPARLSRWIAEVSGDLRPGGQIHARFTSSWDGPGRIDVCERPRRLLLTMEPGSEEETVIEATLTDEHGKTRLLIEERGFPLGEVAAHGAGWQAHVEDLASYLAGQEPSSWRDRWLQLSPHYAQLAEGLS